MSLGKMSQKAFDQPGLSWANHGVLGPFATTQQHAHGLVFVHPCDHLGKGFGVVDLGVGHLGDHIALTNARAQCGFSDRIHPHTASQFQFFFQRVGQIADAEAQHLHPGVFLRCLFGFSRFGGHFFRFEFTHGDGHFTGHTSAQHRDLALGAGFGAEHLLTRRAVSREVGEKIVKRIKWWEDYTSRNKMEMNNNPSPGNKLGGLTTILEKSLGAAAKGGTTTMTGVYEYAEKVDTKGFVFMDTPGYDPVSATGQVAGGANILCFTTGRGSAYGCKPTPSIKLATNSEIYRKMIDDMDINCGDILDGVSIEEKGKEIFAKVLEVASGTRSKSEELGYGDAEFVPWTIGATM